MINLGIIAQARRGAAGEPVFGATVDFIAGTYEVGGTNYALGDIFDDLTSGDITEGRGLLVHYLNDLRPTAKGALKDALEQPHTGIIDWEDLDYYFEGAVSYLDDSSQFRSGLYQSGSYMYVASGEGVQRTSDNIVYVGTNRLAWNMGTSDTNITWNGEAPPLSDVDGADFMTLAPYDKVFPFGQDLDGTTTIDGYVRRLRIIAPVASSGLQAASVAGTPGLIGTLSTSSVGSSSVTLSFTNAGGASSHEYWVGPSFSRPDYSTRDWFALDTDKIITGLTPSTGYTVFVRGRNAAGPGGCGYSNRVQFTTTA
jgi:hypothetical protein